MKPFNFSSRELIRENLQSTEFDLIIIGGGINGAGVARDAAYRGMKVALVEARDFASGTSSKSSKMIHGGIRYLENMEFKLVFEALNERTKLFEMAPHLVHPLRFMIPLFTESRVGMNKMGLGMWLYDALSLFQAPQMHERLNAKETAKRMPDLKNNGLVGSFIYSDAYMDDDRLVIETLRSANESGAQILNYTHALHPMHNDQGQVAGLKARDALTGEEYLIRGRHIVSCVGAWTDEVAPQLVQDWKKKLRPTKGVHITLPKDRLPLTSAVVMGAEKGNRIVFGIPRHEMIIIGTTDTDYKESPTAVTATVEDIKYLLQITEQYFPGANLKVEDIIASYAGVRPLVEDGSSTEGKTSREHSIMQDDSGVTFVAGGKYTTYRLICEQTVDMVLKCFAHEDQIRFRKLEPTDKPLNRFSGYDANLQAKALVDSWAKQFKRPLREIDLLTDRHSLEAEQILNNYPTEYTYWQLEAAHAIDHTMCFNLVDFFTRRTPLFLADKNHGLEFLDEIAQVFAEKLAWSVDETSAQKDGYAQFIVHELDWVKNF